MRITIACKILCSPSNQYVYLSAGVGRTGCFIVIDAMLERMKHEKTVDIYGHVTCMRAQRNYMVQTEDQYIFIHEALLEAATCGNTEVPARNLYGHIQKLTQPLSGETVTDMELEFKVTAHHMIKWILLLSLMKIPGSFSSSSFCNIIVVAFSVSVRGK